MKVIQVPFLKTLSTQDVYDFIVKRLKFKSIFKYIANSGFQIVLGYAILVRVKFYSAIAHALLGDVLKEWVTSKMSNWEQYIINKKRFTVNVYQSFQRQLFIKKRIMYPNTSFNNCSTTWEVSLPSPQIGQ